MLFQFFSVGLLMLVCVMSPGPDFALVTKNTVLHSRRAGLFTTLGILSAVFIHMTYCILGLAVIIANSLLLFNAIKYLGAAYLIYIGTRALLAKHVDSLNPSDCKAKNKTSMNSAKAFRQGFLCNLLNPKATLFFLALFTVVIKPSTPLWVQLIYAVEMALICFTWFSCLTLMLSHRHVVALFNRASNYIEKTLGVFLIGFGLALVIVKR